MYIIKQGTQEYFSKLKWLHTFQRTVVCRPLELTLIHILVFRRLALSCFFGAGKAAAVEQTFVECGFTGEPEERAARFRFLFSLWIQWLKMVSCKERAESDKLPFWNPCWWSRTPCFLTHMHPASFVIWKINLEGKQSLFCMRGSVSCGWYPIL